MLYCAKRLFVDINLITSFKTLQYFGHRTITTVFKRSYIQAFAAKIEIV